jgi:hypothetical protein
MGDTPSTINNRVIQHGHQTENESFERLAIKRPSDTPIQLYQTNKQARKPRASDEKFIIYRPPFRACAQAI